MNIEFDLQLRGQIVTCKSGVCPAEPDVGIMSEYPDGYSLFDENGQELLWELTKEEEQWLDSHFLEAVDAAYRDDE